MRPLRLPIRKIGEVALRAVSGYGEDRVSISAAGITYFALISIFPMALVGLSVAGFVYGGTEEQQRLLDDIMDNLPLDDQSGREDLEDVITSIVEARGTLGIIGLVSALYTGSALFTSVRVALNGIFRGEKARSFFVGKLIDIGMVALFGTLLLVSIVSSFLLTVFSDLVDDVIGEDAGAVTRLGVMLVTLLIPVLISTFVFVVLYASVPARNVGWKNALPGALLAAVLFEVLKAGFGIYAANFTNYDATYGSLGFVILLLAFIYFAAQIMLFGAEVARATEEVQHGWPLPEEQSKLVATRKRVAEWRQKVLRLIGRAPKEEPVGMLPVAVSGVEVVVPSEGTPAPVEAVPRDPPARAGAAGWFGAAAVFGSVVAAAFVIARKR